MSRTSVAALGMHTHTHIPDQPKCVFRIRRCNYEYVREKETWTQHYLLNVWQGTKERMDSREATREKGRERERAKSLANGRELRAIARSLGLCNVLGSVSLCTLNSIPCWTRVCEVYARSERMAETIIIAENNDDQTFARYIIKWTKHSI